MAIWNCDISAQCLLLLEHLNILRQGFMLSLAWYEGQVLCGFLLLLELPPKVELVVLLHHLAPGLLGVQNPVTIIPNVTMMGYVWHWDNSRTCSVSPFRSKRSIKFESRISFAFIGEYLPALMGSGDGVSPFVNGRVKWASMYWEICWLWNIVDKSTIHLWPI